MSISSTTAGISIRSHLNDAEEKANNNLQAAVTMIKQLGEDDNTAIETHSRLLLTVFEQLKEIHGEVKLYHQQLTLARSEIEVQMHEILTEIRAVRMEQKQQFQALMNTIEEKTNAERPNEA